MLEDLAEVQTMAEIRQEHLPSESVGEDKSAEDYLEYLSGKGVALNPKLFPSIFYLKNGLPYTGMAVKETVGAGEVLIRVPQELIMSTAKAFMEPELHAIFKSEPFFKVMGDWEQDRILIVYSLFLMYKKDESHPWYQMIKRLPRQCDIACFWKEEELNQFKDKTIRSAAKIDLNSFEREWSAFQQVQSKHLLLQNEEFNKQDYRICFMALNNRAFGTKVKYISLVPMAELFNHHCSKVFYNVQKQKRTQFIDDDCDGYSETSSLGSCDSTDYLEEGEFAYDKIDVVDFSWKVRECFNLNKKEKERVEEESKRVMKKIEEQLNWEDFTLLFVGPLIFKTKVIQKEYLAGRKLFEKAMQEWALIDRTIEKYKEAVSKHCLSVNRRPYKPVDKKKQQQNGFLQPKPTKDYESLIIKTSRFDRTDTNGQIYFKYGPYSNRSLLLRYGFAIQGNKYEHIWLSFNITKCVREFPDVLDKVMSKKLSLLRKYKVYSHRLCMDMIVFFRLNNWAFWGQKAVEDIFTVTNYQKEIAVLEQINQILEKNIATYEDEYDLSDSSMNYHQYFITVYHVEKLRILQKQSQMLSMLIEVLYKLDNGAHFEQATESLTKSEKIVLNPYLTTIRY